MGMGDNIIYAPGTIVGDIKQTIGAERGKPESRKEQNRKEKKYDVALSYASEQEVFVGRVAKILQEEGLELFYAPDREREYQAQDMCRRFYRIYRYQCEFAVCFVSKEYLQKDYTMMEYESSCLKNKDTGKNRMIVVNFDGSNLPCLDPDISYIDAKNIREVQVADHILEIIKYAGGDDYE